MPISASSISHVCAESGYDMNHSNVKTRGMSDLSKRTRHISLQFVLIHPFIIASFLLFSPLGYASELRHPLNIISEFNGHNDNKGGEASERLIIPLHLGFAGVCRPGPPVEITGGRGLHHVLRIYRDRCRCRYRTRTIRCVAV